MDIVPKEANFNDLEEILKLQKLAFQSEAQIYNDFNIAPLQQTLDEIEEEFKSKKFLKVKFDGKIIGSVRAYQVDDTCYIEKLIVHPSFQNRGIGSLLLFEVEKLFSGAGRFELFTGSISKKNLSLYSKRGYREFKKKHLTGNITFIYMEKYGN